MQEQSWRADRLGLIVSGWLAKGLVGHPQDPSASFTKKPGYALRLETIRVDPNTILEAKKGGQAPFGLKLHFTYCKMCFSAYGHRTRIV
jgi:hypothetical protein